MNEVSPPAQLGQMITGYWVSQAIYAAAKLGVADHLTDGPKSIAELAAATETKSDFLYRLLRALASVGIFAEGNEKRFALTPLAEPLQSHVPDSQRALALMVGEEQFLAWSRLVDTVQTGENAFQAAFGQPIFEYLANHPDKAQVFDSAMTGIHGRETGAMLDVYDFSGIQVLADIGGGNGSKITAILQRYPEMRGILFDMPHVVDRARANIESAGLSERCALVGGDFFESVPETADAYVLRHIIHDWDDKKALEILKSCHAAMKPGQRLLVVESVIPPGNDPHMGKFLDLAMMLLPGGKERTAEEYRELFDAAGFELQRIVPTAADVSVMEGIRC